MCVIPIKSNKVEIIKIRKSGYVHEMRNSLVPVTLLYHRNKLKPPPAPKGIPELIWIIFHWISTMR